MYRYVSKQNVFTGGSIPILSAFSLISEWIIDERTTLSLVVDGPYGAVVKLTRGSRFFAMSHKNPDHFVTGLQQQVRSNAGIDATTHRY